MFNLTKNSFSFLNLHSYSNNDQSLSANVLPHLKKGDLCIRDLGFTVLSTVSQFIERGVYFIARKGFNTKIYDINTKKEIELGKELRKHKHFDKEVFVGKDKMVKMRLVAIPVSEKIAQQRREKAKKSRDKRLNPSKEFIELLGYSIYITNIEKEKCTANEIYELYRLRRQIEIIFKFGKVDFVLIK